MLGLFLKGKEDTPVFLLFPGCSPHASGHTRFPFGKCPGLVKDYDVNLLCNLQAFSVFNQDAVFRPFAGPDHDCSRCGQAEGARAGDYQHCHHGQKPVCESVLRGEYRPADERYHGNGHDDRHENRGYLVDRLLYRGLCALRILYHVYDP